MHAVFVVSCRIVPYVSRPYKSSSDCPSESVVTLYRRSVSVLYKDSAYRAVNTPLVIKTNLLMFYKAEAAVCSEIRTKHINAM
jgi:hypothetical protein